MKKFDFKPARNKGYYLDLIDKHIQMQGASSVLSALLYSEKDGLYFESGIESFKGVYIEKFPLIRNGEFFVTFNGRFEEDELGILHFKGWIIPSLFCSIAFLVFLALILIFAIEYVFAWVIFSLAFIFFILVNAKLVVEAYRKLENFFV